MSQPSATPTTSSAPSWLHQYIELNPFLQAWEYLGFGTDSSSDGGRNWLLMGVTLFGVGLGVLALVLVLTS